MTRKIGFAVAAFCAVAVAIVTNVRNVDAADHLDPNDRVMAGQAGDIGDLYAWHSDGSVKTVLTFAGPVDADSGTYDRDVLYTIHVDGGDDNVTPDISINARFAQNGDGAWGVWVENLPGADVDVVGAVDSNLTSGAAQVFAGQTDDPFFMDLQGFQDTLADGTLRFDPTRNFFAGLNITALVYEFPTDSIGFDGPYNIWATTAGISE